MALDKITTFKLDEKQSSLVVKIGEMTGAKTSHQAIRDGLRIAGLVLAYQKMKREKGTRVSLEEYLAMAEGLL